MKILVVILLLLAGVLTIMTAGFGDWKKEPPVAIDIAAFDVAKLGPTDGKGYLTLDFPVEPFEHARLDVEDRAKLKLTSRGEAHMTLVTPPEYESLSRKLSAEEIRSHFLLEAAQSRFIRPLCVGQGVVQNDQTWFIVLENDSSLRARESLQKMFIGRGGETKDFRAAEFYPHVTLGYNSRDLHVQDGVVKDIKTCKFPTGHSRRTIHPSN